LARIEIESGDLAKGRGIVDRLRQLAVDEQWEPRIEFLDAEFQFAERHWQQALDRFEKAAPLLSDSPDLLKQMQLQAAACHARLGNTELQLAAYREAARTDPAWAPARLGIASTLYEMGRLDQALDEYRQIRQLNGMSGAGAAGEAKMLILKNLSRPPAEQTWTDVDQILDQLMINNPNSPQVALLRAEALAGRQRALDAEKLLTETREKDRKDIQLWTASVALAVREQQWEAAERLLDEARKEFGDKVWLRLMRGTYWLTRYKGKSSAKLQTLADESDAFPLDERVKLDQGLATLLQNADDSAQAKRLARRACDIDPAGLEARILLFELAIQTSDVSQARLVLQEIRDLEGAESGGPFWQYGQAAVRLLAVPAAGALDDEGHQSLDTALQNLGQARKLRPGWARATVLTARILDRRGESGSALQSYLEAIDLGERSPSAIRRTIQLLYASQRYAEADQLLRRLEQQPIIFTGDIERMASRVSAQLENLDRALETARKAAADSRDWRDHLWLGQLEVSSGLDARSAQHLDEANSHFAEAEKSLRLAVQLSPEIPQPWVTLIRFYAATDRKSEAEASIRQAERKLAKTDAGTVALAMCYELVGRVEDAAKRVAVIQSSRDPTVVRWLAEHYINSRKLDDAEIQLLTIVSGQVAAKPQDVVWARRTLASVLIASGRYPKIQEALVLIEQNLSGNPTPEDQKVKAIALAACPQVARHREAIKIFEGLLSVQPDTPDVQLAIAELYLRESDWPKCAKQLRTLVSIHDQDTRAIFFFADQLLQHQETTEAERWIGRLAKLSPNEFASVGLKAAALVQREQVDEAIQSLRAFLGRPGFDEADRIAQTRLVATTLDDLSRRTTASGQAIAAAKLQKEAEHLLRDNALHQPDQQLVLAAFLARHGRFDDALTAAESAWTIADTDTVTRAANDLLASGIAVSDRNERIEKLLLRAAEKHKRPVPLLLTLADLHMRQERFDEAKSIYREVLRKDESNVVAMNNLATLLAIQRQELDESHRLIEKAIRIAGPLPSLLDTRASVFLSLDQPQPALTDLDEAIRDQPLPSRLFHRALVFSRLGQATAAEHSLNQARSLGFKPEQLNSLERVNYYRLTAEQDRPTRG
jgi:cellulose synthase operon protein C